MVRIERGRESRDRLVEAGYAVDWREYPMEHQICGEELSDIGRWLTGVLSPPAGECMSRPGVPAAPGPFDQMR